MIAARSYGLAEGEVIKGRVVQLPSPGAPHGNSLMLDIGEDVIRLPATTKVGHTVLERALEDVSVGAELSIAYRGKRTTKDGERRYRDYAVEVTR